MPAEIKLRLSELELSQGYAENYAVEVLSDEVAIATIRFRHGLVERQLPDDTWVEDFHLQVSITCPDRLMPWYATDICILGAAVAYLNDEVRRQELEVIENLFESRVGNTIAWRDAPMWLTAQRGEMKKEMA